MTSQTSRVLGRGCPARHTSSTLIVLAVLVFAPGCGRDARPVEPEPPPNVLVILVDALLADHLGTGGYELPTSPTIDRLAEEGVVFSSAFAQGFDHFEAVRGLGARRLNNRLLTRLESAGATPFFAYLHYLDVHWPYTKRLVGKEEGFLEHGKLLHSYAPYDEVLRVPLVFRLPPGLLTPVPEVSAPAGLIDLLPTLLELASLEPAPQAQGRSLVPLMRSGSATERWIFAESADSVAVRNSTHKLIRFHDGSLEFYDLVSDPGEQAPQTGACDDRCGQLAEQLVGHQQAMAELRELTSPGETAILDEEELEELRSLGYL